MAAAITTTATSLEGQLVEVVRAIEAAEKAVPETTRENRVSITLDVDNGRISISSTLNATISGSGGQIVFAPVTYLP
ncbi:hypothetical protein ACKFKG_03200 [Phormidesmis sp. 146-35]